MKRITAFITLLIVILIPLPGFSLNCTVHQQMQISVREVAIMALSNTDTITLVVTKSSVPGVPPQVSADGSTFLRYTTINGKGKTRMIGAALSGQLPAGVCLRITGSLASTGYGVSAGRVTLCENYTVLVSQIGSCSTGNTAGTGLNLRYDLVVTDASSLVIGDQPLSINFTISDDM
jgi:hypothetical protein